MEKDGGPQSTRKSRRDMFYIVFFYYLCQVQLFSEVSKNKEKNCIIAA